MNWQAVLTGDIIRSSKMLPSNRVALYNAFADLSSLLKQNYPLDMPYDISNFRGDGWQAVCLHPEKSLEVGLFIRSYLQFHFKEERLDTRFAIGIGSTHFIPSENVTAGDGEAYSLSGALLDALTTERMAVFFSPAGASAQPAMDGMISLLDFIVSGWSASQAQAVFLTLHHYTQTEIGLHWLPEPITQASVSAILKAAGWSRVKKSLSSFEQLVASASQPPKRE